MPVTISGDGGIAGISSLGGGDFVAGSLTSSGDLIAGPQAVDRASLFVDDSANNVGINTTTPSTLLEVQGKGDKQVLRLTNPTNTDTAIVFNDSSNTSGNAVQFGTKSGAFQFITSSLERLRITADGKFGINTDTPTELIETRGNVNDSNLFLTTNSTDADSGATIGFQSTTNGWALPAAHAQIKGGRVNGSNGYLDFFTRQSATSTRVMRLNENGHVGIGIDNPVTTVHIESTNTAGDLEIDRIDNSQNGPELILRHISSSPANNDYIGQITFSGKDDAANNTTVARIDGVMNNVANGSESGEIVFNTRHNGTFSEKARFNSTGNLAFVNGNGIDFSASQGSGANASILDDYEEGTFDPLFSNGGTATYQQRAGYYVKTGRQCTIHVQIRLASLGSASGHVKVTNLPFRIRNSNPAYGSTGTIHNNLTATNTTNNNALFVPSTFTIDFYSGNTTNMDTYSHAALGTGALIFGGTYLTED